MFYVATRNVPVFFSTPQSIPNKITKPIKENVRLSALWIGHSTLLIQMDDKVILVDPVFENVIGGFMMRKKERRQGSRLFTPIPNKLQNTMQK